MSLYLLIAAAVFAANAGVTFFTKKVTNHQLNLTLIAFFPAWLAAGLPVADIPAQLLYAALAFIAGLWAMAKAGAGGGIPRAFIMAVLWVPGGSAVFHYVCFTLVASCLVGFLVAKLRHEQEISDYAGYVLACCAGFAIYLYQTPAFHPDMSVIKTTQETAPALRGLSEGQG